VAQKYEAIFLEEMKRLGVSTPDFRPRATECIPQMVDMIKELISKGYAYASETPFGNDVYFRVKNFSEYGKLSNKKVDELRVGARIEAGESKEDPLDFTLWKATKPGEPSWDSPWGKGRPGWHIECSAMIHAHFPEGIDIHMGGLDLIFPHHENEIAQSEACFDKKLATYWVHNNLLTLEREKMSKSIGNIFTTEQFLESYGPEVLRLFLFQHHYRSPIDFSEESITRSEALLIKLYNAKKLLMGFDPNFSSERCEKWPELEAALWDDFNTAKAMGLIMKALREAFRENTPEKWNKWSLSLKYFHKVYGILEGNPDEKIKEIHHRKLKRLGISEDKAAVIQASLDQRAQLRAEKNFEASDKIRAQLEAQGVLIMDNPDASTWSIKH
jgi:cysteinyl-tRNA synthetase